MDRIPRFTCASDPAIEGDYWHQPQIYYEYRDVVIEEDIECLATHSKKGNRVTISAGTTISVLRITANITLNPILAETEIKFSVSGLILEDNFYFDVISYGKLIKACDFN